jgi:hypothetical protein
MLGPVSMLQASPTWPQPWTTCGCASSYNAAVLPRGVTYPTWQQLFSTCKEGDMPPTMQHASSATCSAVSRTRVAACMLLPPCCCPVAGEDGAAADDVDEPKPHHWAGRGSRDAVQAPGRGTGQVCVTVCGDTGATIRACKGSRLQSGHVIGPGCSQGIHRDQHKARGSGQGGCCPECFWCVFQSPYKECHYGSLSCLQHAVHSPCKEFDLGLSCWQHAAFCGGCGVAAHTTPTTDDGTCQYVSSQLGSMQQQQQYPLMITHHAAAEAGADHVLALVAHSVNTWGCVVMVCSTALCPTRPALFPTILGAPTPSHPCVVPPTCSIVACTEGLAFYIPCPTHLSLTKPCPPHLCPPPTCVLLVFCPTHLCVRPPVLSHPPAASWRALRALPPISCWPAMAQEQQSLRSML